MAIGSKFIDLNDQIAVVTGAGKGIGRGIARELAEAGADVIVADMDLESANSVSEEIEKIGRESIALETDVTDQTSTDSMIDGVIKRFGRVDILVNNAGVGGGIGWTTRNVPTPDDWDACFKVNVLGIVHATQSVESHMIDRKYGKIVNIASQAGRRGGGRAGADDFSHYAASKASAINVTQAWAYKLAGYGINVNSICPGHIWTPLSINIRERRLIAVGDSNITGRQIFEELIEEIVPLGREQTPEDIGKAVAFLASDRAKSIVGQALNVDGGVQMN